VIVSTGDEADVMGPGHLHAAQSRLQPNQERLSRAIDSAARATVVAIFTGMTVLNVGCAYTTLLDRADMDATAIALTVAARVSNALFLALVAATVLTRLRPVAKAQGVQPRVSALLGTFLCTTLAFLSPADLHWFWTTLSAALIIAGASLAFVVLRWLGRSFSIMAEARSLVTSGPYALVRHPLYVAEELAAIGILIQVFSPIAIAIFAAHLLLQLQRTRNEETVLRATFPEYAEYAARTPWLIPGWRVRRVRMVPAQ
jgi:protein-S-isoprenylcysteine O-methyltransferase Ste14